MPVSFWIFLFVCLVSFIPVRRDHGETWRSFKEAKGKERFDEAAHLFALWSVAVFSLIGTLCLGFESIISDRKDSQRDAAYLAVSNRLSRTESKYNESTNDLAAVKKAVIEANVAAQQATNAVNNANIAILQNLNRHLSQDQKVQLLNVIAPYPKLKFAFFIEDSVSDSKGIANDLAQVFLKNGWEMEQSETGMMPVGAGIFLRSKEVNDATTKAIAATMNSFGIDTYIDEMRVFGRHSLTNTVFIVIGHRPAK